MNILVRRSGALGDVVLTTPVIRRLRREHPDSRIAVLTAYPDVFTGSKLAVLAGADESFDRYIDLDLAYERRPHLHIVQAYMQEAFGDDGEPGDLQQELTFDHNPVFPKGRRYVAVHAAQAGWRNRTLPSSTWIEVCRLLRAADLWPILIGTKRDALPEAAITSFYSSVLASQARLIASCACFVGSDSGLLHVAGATGVPIVGVFTCADPRFRLPWRQGQLGRDCIAVQPKGLDCLGCLHRAPVPTTVESCERGDIACVREVSAQAIVDAAVQLIG